ncbi:hypothetical protein [Tessaracoccus antarcticus]|uniref:Uncharacterized protein n=1 Tax=Tessaracoccus antarcticus TaxID=2479848 RepID=A0A3M0GAE2_9ACTN|nr:hypothetical protein [Tessaracoccus antarcticus]RMB61874.1 hypothetical protein EAX62_04540 [Tessaracoccus antarcticus]
MSKRKVVAIVGAAAAFAAVTVSAATLGGLQTDSVGANSNKVSAPVSKGVALNWSTEFSAKDQAYVVSSIALAPISTEEKIPEKATVRVTLTDASGDVLGEYNSTDGATSFEKPGKVVTAHDVANASVVINGGNVTTIADETD